MESISIININHKPEASSMFPGFIKLKKMKKQNILNILMIMMFICGIVGLYMLFSWKGTHPGQPLKLTIEMKVWLGVLVTIFSLFLILNNKQ
jgi:flagellar basal body-associated protein FliL